MDSFNFLMGQDIRELWSQEIRMGKESLSMVMARNMKEIGRMETHMGMEFWPFKIYLDMKDSGTKENTTVKALTWHQPEPDTKVTGLRENITVLESLSGLTVVFTEVNGKIAESMETASSQVYKVWFMRVNGLKGGIMVLVN